MIDGMTVQRIHATVTTDTGTYSGPLWRGGNPETLPTVADRLDVGMSPTPSEYAQWFTAVAPAVPAFCRVFVGPGRGMPNPMGSIPRLPDGCLPWVSHKDAVPIDDIHHFWGTFLDPPADGRRYRWTFRHEAAPDDGAALSEYRAYWRDLISAARDHPHIELVQIQSNYALRWRPDTYWRDWLIPRVALGLDCYPLTGYRYEPPESMFGLLTYAAAEIEAPAWGVPELGADVRSPQDRARWIQQCHGYLAHQGAAFLGLWCARDTKTSIDYRPTDPATLATFRDLLAR